MNPTKFFLRMIKLSRLPLMFCLILLSLFFAPSARAQFFGGTYGSQSLSCIPSTLTNTAAYPFYFAGVTNLPQASLIYVPNGRNVTLAISAGASASQSGTVSVPFVRSLDGVTFDSTPFLTLSVAYTGTTVVTAMTNVDVGAAGYLAPLSITNAATGNYASNVVVRYSYKPGF